MLVSVRKPNELASPDRDATQNPDKCSRLTTPDIDLNLVDDVLWECRAVIDSTERQAKTSYGG